MASGVVAAIPQARRAVAALVGGIVADAAARPLHWIYDGDQLATATAGIEEAPEFVSENKSPFYALPTGANSAYGDQLLVLLRSLASTDGRLDEAAYAASIERNFGPGTAYDLEARLGRPATREDMPVTGPWQQHSIKGFLANYATAGATAPFGVDDSQMDAVVRMPAVVVATLHQPVADMVAAVNASVRTTQDSDAAVAAATLYAQVLRSVLLGTSIDESVRSVLAEARAAKGDEATAALVTELDKVAFKTEKSHAEYVEEHGKSCGLPGGIMGAVHALTTLGGRTGEDAYCHAVRATILAGGCNCSRGTAIGAVVAAAFGPDAIPKSWASRTANAAEAASWGERLVAATQPAEA